MNPQILVLISIRLMALHVVVSGLIFGVSTIAMSRTDSGQSLLSALSYAVASLLAGISLLGFAPSIANAITKDSSSITLGALSVADCYTVGFVVVGLYYLVLYLPSGVGWIFYFLKSALSTQGTEWRRNLQIRGFLEVIGWLVAGYFLLLNARTWALALARKHEVSAPTSIASTTLDQ
jgi:hypothetical protein